jgi:uncharacterized membrane protein
MAIIAYLGILVLIPLLTDAKNDPFVKFHTKQGLLVLIGLVLSSIIVVVPVLGWAIGSLIWIASIILMIIGIMNAANGKQEELPLVGHLARNFHFLKLISSSYDESLSSKILVSKHCFTSAKLLL